MDIRSIFDSGIQHMEGNCLRSRNFHKLLLEIISFIFMAYEIV